MEGRIVAGVAAGVADHLGVDPLIVRLAFVALTLVGGAGLLLYVLGWLLLPAPGSGPSIAQRAVTDRRSAGQAVSVGLIVLGVLLGLRATGVWFNDSVVWPVTLGAAGLALVWRQAGSEERAPFLELAGRPAADATVRSRRLGLLRVAAGMVLVVAGAAGFLVTHKAFSALGPALITTAVVAGGVFLLFAPWWWRLGTELASERRERVRSQERAEVAAHLHDSVLQTLALIQRQAGDAAAVQRLARRQEAELRSWLYGRPAAPTDSLAAAVQAAAREVEDRHGATVDVVVVGDRPLDERLGALVAAAREAMVNAAVWSGQAQVSVYVEVEQQRVSAFVRDRGRGFDPGAVGPGHHGIADSIVARMARHGGSGTVASAAGEGTEVSLEMPQ